MQSFPDFLSKAGSRLSGITSGQNPIADFNLPQTSQVTNYFGGLFGRSTSDESSMQQLPSQSFWLEGVFSMTQKQRFYGFLMSVGLGLFCIALSTIFLPTILLTSRKFAFLYTLGNVLLVISTMFLMGPVQQFKTMFGNNERLIPSCIYTGSLLITLLCAFQGWNVAVIMTFIVVQLIAMAWYLITYIPFGQRMCGMLFSAFRSMF
ncbi:vesicle transport protein [Acrasis kona]|uniref:Vesicle transport protein n=1 Tax=Acrasis kona TaxID=1008807 RepID=A0AAW2ZLB1_9EUKA